MLCFILVTVYKKKFHHCFLVFFSPRTHWSLTMFSREVLPGPKKPSEYMIAPHNYMSIRYATVTWLIDYTASAILHGIIILMESNVETNISDNKMFTLCTLLQGRSTETHMKLKHTTSQYNDTGLYTGHGLVSSYLHYWYLPFSSSSVSYLSGCSASAHLGSLPQAEASTSHTSKALPGERMWNQGEHTQTH